MSKSSHAVRVLLHRIGVAGPARARAFGGTGASACGSRGRGSVLAVAALTVALALAVGAAPAGASGVLQIEPELYQPAVYATRAHIGVEVHTGGLEVKWRAEYATSESGPWTVAGSRTTEKLPSGGFVINGNIFLEGPGEEVGQSGFGFGYADAMLRHLTPSTTYYARFHVESSANEAAERTFKFTTTAITKPEFFEVGSAVRGPGSIPGDGRAIKASHGASPTTVAFETQVEANGAETKYFFGYAPAEQVVVLPQKTVLRGRRSPPAPLAPWWRRLSVAEGFADPEAKLTGLTPETTYYARVRATNEQGEAVVEMASFTTETDKPRVGALNVRNVTGVSAHVEAALNAHGAETEWRFEDAKSAAGPWAVVAGAEGVISQAEAEAGDNPDVGPGSLV